MDSDGTPDWQAALSDPDRQDTGAETANEEESLTTTEKFSRELFATVAALNQAGVTDPAAMEELGVQLAAKISQAPVRKIFTQKNITVNNTISDEMYGDTMDALFAQNPVKGDVTEILNRFTLGDGEVDVSVLPELDPILSQTQKIISGMQKISVPQKFVAIHLNLLNSLERVYENVSDIRLFESDILLSTGAVMNYDQNATLLSTAVNNFVTTVP